MEHKRIFGLDIIRAIAVSMVVFYHSLCLLEPLIQLPFGIGRFLGKIIAASQCLGGLGVELFFVLSGVLIGGILIREYVKAPTFSLRFVRDFWIKRWSRTLPNFYLFLGLNLILAYCWHGASFDWRFLFFLQNFSSPHPHFFSEAWSLSVEEWFYLTLPLVLLGASMFIKNRPKKQAIVITLIIYVSFFFGMRVLNALNPVYGEFGQDASVRKIVVYRLDAIAFGVIIAYLNHFHGAFLGRPKVRRAMFAAGLMLSLSLLLFSYLSVHPNYEFYQNPRIRFLSDVLLFTFLPMGLSLLLPSALAMERPFRSRLGLDKVVTHISLISYSMYLIHFSLIFVPFFSEIKSGSPGMALLVYSAYWGVTILFSTLVHHIYEKPATEFLRKKLIKRPENPMVGQSTPRSA